MNTELSTAPESDVAQNGSLPPSSTRSRPAAPRSSSPGLEAIDAILWRLEARETTSKSLVVGVTGCGTKSGTTTVATNLALRAGMQGCRTLLITASSLSRGRQAQSEIGLWDIVSGESSPRESQPTEIADNVFALGGGTLEGAARVNPQLVSEMLDEFRRQYDAIIFDLPPAEHLGNALPVAKHLPGVVLVVGSEKTSQHEAQRALESLAEDGVPVCGTVLNQYRNHVPRWLRRWF